jgi:hypothetical protein
MNPNALQELRWRYLLKLYELSEGGLHDEVDLNRLKPQIGMTREEIRSVERYLLDKDLISYKCRVMCVRITTRGIDEVERIMAQTYAAKEFRVLKTIHETKHKAFNGWVDITDLEKALPDIPRQELFMILEDLEERKGLIGSIDQAVWIVPAGIEELEQAEREPNHSTQYFPAQIINNYTLNVQGDNKANIQQGGQGNTQTSIVINSDFEQAIKQLLAGVEQSQALAPIQKLKTKGDIQTLNELALMEKTPEVIEEAETRVTAIQSVLSTTADLVSLGMVIIPIVRAAFGI